MTELLTQQVETMMVECKSELKLDDGLDAKLRRVILQAVYRIMDFCNRDDLPEPLEYTVISIAEDMLKADGTIETKQEVTNISRGDVSIAYRNTGISNIGKSLSTVDFVKDHEKQLIKYKKFKKL